MSRSSLHRARAGVAAALVLAGATAAHAQTVTAGPLTNPANGNVYLRLGGTSNIPALRAAAANLGGHLVTITSAEENFWIHFNFVWLSGSSYFIGLSDEDNEGFFFWDTGEPPVYTNWSAGEGGKSPNEDYAAFVYYDLEWRNRASDAPNISGAIVELDGGRCEWATPVQPDSTAFGTLDDVSFSNTGCAPKYNIPRTWFKLTGDNSLVTVSTCVGALNFDSVVEVYRGDCQSLQCLTINDDADCGLGGFGSTVTFAALEGEVYFIAVSEVLSQWGEKFTFNLTINNEPLTLPAPVGLPVFNPTTSRTYLLHDEAPVDVAIGAAAYYGSYLASITDSGEAAFITQHFADALHPALIGLSDMFVESTFRWMNGEPVVYTQFAPGQPDGSYAEPYVAINGSGQWMDVAPGFYRSIVELDPDRIHQAVPLPIASTITAGFGFATEGVGESDFPCGLSGRPSIWYRVVGDGRDVTISTCDSGTTFDTILRVFAKSGPLGNLTCVGNNDDDPNCGTTASAVTFYAESGADYFIALSKYSGSPQPSDVFALHVSSTPAAPLPVLAQGPIDPVTCSRVLVTGSAPPVRHFDESLALGGDMVVIPNAARNESVRSVLIAAGRGTGIIGFTDRDHEGIFSWLDGSPTSFTHWTPGEPDNGSNSDFVTLLAAGQWIDAHYLNAAPGLVEIPVSAFSGGHIRGALRFFGDGTAPALMPDNAVPWLSSGYTIECWIRTAQSGVVLGQTGLDGGWAPTIYVGVDGRIRAAEWCGSLGVSVLTGPDVRNNQWTHVAFTRTNFNRYLCINGEVIDQTIGIAQSNYSPNGYAYTIGAGNWGGWPSGAGASTFNGEIDELRVWSVTRTAAEITQTKDTRYFTPDLYPNLLISYTMDDAGGRLVFDSKAARNAPFASTGAPPQWIYEDRDNDGGADACQPDCPADIDGNGVVNSTDVSEFINIWFADQTNGTLNADFNRDGTSNSTDVSDMINAYFEASGECLS